MSITKKSKLLLATLLWLGMAIMTDSTSETESTESPSSSSSRKGKLFPVFQIVTFPNAPCSGGGTRNGTCYTSEECSSRGGSGSGTCAQGFGVCCIFTLSCGSTSSENCTYLVQSSTTTTPTTNPCTYTICKCSTNICRIRLDFNTFTIAAPQVGTALDAAAVSTANGGAIGDCITDSFSITSPGNVGSPIICGFNTGQHLYMDASDSCNVAQFDIGASGDTRQWDIKVTQYECGHERGGPDGCLQYFTGNTGTVSSFNFPTTNTAGATSTTTHLSNQCYTMCFRQELNRCSICFTTAYTNTAGDNTPDTEAAQTSFGLSVSNAGATATQLSDTSCTTDFLAIPNAEANPASGAAGIQRICGRVFSVIGNTIITGASVCTQVRPFRITFKSDADEVATSTDMANTNEQRMAPAGIIGFSLNFVQQVC